MRARFRWTRERYYHAQRLNRLALRLGFYRAPPIVDRWFELWRQHPAACGSDPLDIPVRARLTMRRNPDDDIPF
jgi:hypothetical protein